MTDPYTPTLAEFSFPDEEVAVISSALKTEDPWGWKPDDNETKQAIKNIRNKILTYHLARHNHTCCYCRTNLHGAGPFMTDREHILPKGKASFKPYSYTMWNLAAACKRCNMQFKRSGDDFVIDKTDPAKFQSNQNYCFIHPNFDRWEDYLHRIQFQSSDKMVVIFLRVQDCAKADYTYDFFGLQELQVNTFDSAQGLTNLTEETELTIQVRKLADLLG